MEQDKSLIIAFIIIFLFIGLIVGKKMVFGLVEKQSNNDDEHLILLQEVHFKNIRQLTFSGENAEAYFSSDGRKLIFQAHDGDELCDQIYIMDIESGKTRLVSTGDGVTTCSYFQYPQNDKIIYSSTHH